MSTSTTRTFAISRKKTRRPKTATPLASSRRSLGADRFAVVSVWHDASVFFGIHLMGLRSGRSRGIAMATKVQPRTGQPGAAPSSGKVATSLTNEEILRYSRHLIMPEVGMEGQLKLKNSKVLLIGTGGLGAPLGLYLAAAGVGRLGL